MFLFVGNLSIVMGCIICYFITSDNVERVDFFVEIVLSSYEVINIAHFCHPSTNPLSSEC
jgi:hypothetical protein